MSSKRILFVGCILLLVAIDALGSWEHTDAPLSEASDVQPSASSTNAFTPKGTVQGGDNDSNSAVTVTLRGNVVDPEEQGIEGANVCAAARIVGRQQRLCQTTGPSGDFVFEFNVRSKVNVSVAASKTGWLVLTPTIEAPWENVMLSPARTQAERTLRMFSGGSEVHGTVSDSEGGVVEGALVVMSTISNSGYTLDTLRSYRGGGRTYTDAHGRYSIWGDVRGASMVNAIAPGYSSDYGDIPYHFVEGNPIEVNMALEPEAVVRGRVVDLEGNGVANIGVQMVSPSGPNYSPPMRAQSNLAGEFEIHGVGGGKYMIRVRDGELREVAPPEVTVWQGQVSDVVLVRVSQARELRGIAEFASGTDCPTSFVSVKLDGELVYRHYNSSSTQEIRIGGMLPQVYETQFICSGAGTSSKIDVDLSKDDEDTYVIWDVGNDDGVDIRGTLTDANATPVVGGTVEVKSDEVSGDPVRTDKDGAFVMLNVERGKTTLLASDRKENKVELSIEVEDDMGDIQIELPKARSLRVRVRTPKGVPHQHAFVWVMASPKPRWGRTNNAGEVVIGGITEEEVEVRLMETNATSFRPNADKLNSSKTVVLRPEGETETEFIINNRNAKLSGVVRSESGEPIKGARIGISPIADEDQIRKNPLRGAETNADGRFTLDLLPENMNARFSAHYRGQGTSIQTSSSSKKTIEFPLHLEE